MIQFSDFDIESVFKRDSSVALRLLRALQMAPVKQRNEYQNEFIFRYNQWYKNTAEILQRVYTGIRSSK